MLVRQLLQREFFIIQALTTRLVRPTKVLLLWTGWNRSRKEVSLLHLQLQHVTGQFRKTVSQSQVHLSIVLISSILLDTLTLQLRLSVHSVYLMVQLVYLMLRVVLSLSQRTYGVRLIHTTYHVWLL